MKPGVARNPESWVDEYGDDLYRYALARLRDPHLAEELVQETFLAALKGYESFAGRSSEKTWLVGILKHKIIDHYRRAGRLAQLDEGSEARLEHDEIFMHEGEWAGHFDAQAGPVEWRDNPAAAFERAEFWQAFQLCLMSLPERIANAFTLREVEGLSTTEICKVLNVTTTNLWVMLHRARAHLRHCIEMHWFRPAVK